MRMRYNLLKIKTISRFYLPTAILAVIGLSDVYGQTSPQAVIKARKEKSGNKVIVHYKVTNAGSTPIGAFTIGTTGQESVPDKDAYELTVAPVGFQYGREETEPDVLLPASVAFPTGWKVEPRGVHANEKIGLRWRRGNGVAIQPGSTLEGFSVTLPKEDPAYLNGHVAVYTTMGNLISLQIEEEIVNQPPQLNVRIHPDNLWPPNNKMVEVRVKIEAKDDGSKKPQILLVSITCNDNCDLERDISSAKIGSDDRDFSLRASRSDQQAREYSITYSATDAEGLTVSQTVKVMVKHDYRHDKSPHGSHEGHKDKHYKRK